jgi:preprotein translocase subunit YajC
LFESIAFAMGPAPQGGGGTDMLMQFLPLILMFVIFWFLLIRPQQKRAKAHKQMLAELKRGDHVMTGSGLIGRIVKIDAEKVLLECGDSKLHLSRGAISGVLSEKDAKGEKTDKSDKGGKSGKSEKKEKAESRDSEDAYKKKTDEEPAEDKPPLEEKAQNP